MKFRWLLIALSLLSISAVPVLAADDVGSMPACNVCNMSREKHDFSRVLLKLKDGTNVGTCSITCAAVELSKRGEDQVASILVADYRTRELIDTKKAVWVMGGSRKGVMTNVPKWAFATDESAQAFIDELGGKRATFEEVLAAASSDTRSGRKPGHSMK